MKRIAIPVENKRKQKHRIKHLDRTNLKFRMTYNKDYKHTIHAYDAAEDDKFIRLPYPWFDNINTKQARNQVIIGLKSLGDIERSYEELENRKKELRSVMGWIQNLFKIPYLNLHPDRVCFGTIYHQKVESSWRMLSNHMAKKLDITKQGVFISRIKYDAANREVKRVKYDTNMTISSLLEMNSKKRYSFSDITWFIEYAFENGLFHPYVEDDYVLDVMETNLKPLPNDGNKTTELEVIESDDDDEPLPEFETNEDGEYNIFPYARTGENKHKGKYNRYKNEPFEKRTELEPYTITNDYNTTDITEDENGNVVYLD